MPGLRYLGCRRCGTVYADPDEPPYCDDCGGCRFADLTEELQTDTYFFRRDQSD